MWAAALSWPAAFPRPAIIPRTAALPRPAKSSGPTASTTSPIFPGPAASARPAAVSGPAASSWEANAPRMADYIIAKADDGFSLIFHPGIHVIFPFFDLRISPITIIHIAVSLLHEKYRKSLLYTMSMLN
jgi:hypothetical protein